MSEIWFNIKEASKLMKISDTTLRKKIANGEVDAKDFAMDGVERHYWRIHIDTIDNYGSPS